MDIFKIYRFFLGFFRPARMRAFADRFKINSGMSILDIGGYPYNWELLADQLNITLINLSYHPNQIKKDKFTYIVGDALQLPFKNKTFDIVFSNSVIEHLGDYNNQKKFADEVMRVAKKYQIQTPNRYFFIEPHFLTPFIHFLPRRWKKYLLRNFTVWGIITRPSYQECLNKINEIILLDYKSMKQLFAGAQIYKERFLGLTKSIIACHSD